MSPKENSVYKDIKHNCNLVIEDVKDSVVLIRELDSGNNYVYGVEQFSDQSRFKLTNDTT